MDHLIVGFTHHKWKNRYRLCFISKVGNSTDPSSLLTCILKAKHFFSMGLLGSGPWSQSKLYLEEHFWSSYKLFLLWAIDGRLEMAVKNKYLEDGLNSSHPFSMTVYYPSHSFDWLNGEFFAASKLASMERGCRCLMTLMLSLYTSW
jgi:hypothetical protein